MNKEKVLKSMNHKKLWNKYCSFLYLSIDEYMNIQNQLIEKQFEKWKLSKLGKSIIKDNVINSIDEFRRKVPLTTYYDYADYLLDKDESALPEKPDIWILTTWEGGTKPIKLAPYTRAMLDTFRDNIISCMILSTSKKKGKFTIKNNDRMLYGLAPLPYLTGLLPKMLNEASDIEFLPNVNDAVNMSFSNRNKEGFKLAIKGGLDMFFGLGSVVYAVSKSFTNPKGKSKFRDIFKCKPKMAIRLIKSKIKSKITKREIKPKDLFKLKCFVVAGTDNKYYKDELTNLWGIKPLELFAGTEPSMIGTETWCKDGMYFFPNTCFYEFIKLDDSIKNKKDPSYIPDTYLMNEVQEGEKYELVFSVFHGGAFMRYRCGDVYKCLSLSSDKEETKIPKFEYVDRVPWIIDVAGFTRFSEDEIENVILKSNIDVHDWMATKDFTNDNKPFLHIYLELKDSSNLDTIDIENKLDECFLNIDLDYEGLKKILGFKPLKVTVLKNGSIKKFKDENLYYLKVNSMFNYKEI